MSYAKVEDPAFIAQLNKLSSKKVTNPDILKKLNGEKESKPTFSELPEEESFFSKLPRNLVIGLAKQGHKIINTPYDIAKNIENQGNEFGQMTNKALPLEKYLGNKPKKQNLLERIVEEFNKKNNVAEQLKNPNWNASIAEKIPHQEEYDYAKALGQEGQGTDIDNLIQGGIKYLPEIVGLRGLFRALPLTQRNAAIPLRQAQNLINERNIANIPIQQQTIEHAREFLDRSPHTETMIQEAAAGGYEPIFGMQSQVGHEARSLRRSPLASERRQSPEAHALKQQILTEVRDHLTATGHEDIANLITRGQNKYRRYKYLTENVYPVLRKIGIPIGLTSMLGLGGKEILKIISRTK